MDSNELYQHLLGLTEPWTVERVDLDVAQMHVEVYAGHAPGTRFACPECGRALAAYDHQAERVWRHLDSCQFMTYLHARAPQRHAIRAISLDMWPAFINACQAQFRRPRTKWCLIAFTSCVMCSRRWTRSVNTRIGPCSKRATRSWLRASTCGSTGSAE